MGCSSCIKGNYDFWIKEVDVYSFLYQDLSTWMEGTKFCKPANYGVSVYLPNTDSTTLTLATDKVNKVTPSSFGVTANGAKIADGVYYFVIDEKSSSDTGYCGKEFMKSVAIIPALQCCFDKAFLQYSVLRKKEIEHIDYLIESTRLNASLGKVNTAKYYYDLAKSALMKMDCDCLF